VKKRKKRDARLTAAHTPKLATQVLKLDVRQQQTVELLLFDSTSLSMQKRKDMLQATIPRWRVARTRSQSGHTSATRLSAPTSHYGHRRRQVFSGHGIFDSALP